MNGAWAEGVRFEATMGVSLCVCAVMLAAGCSNETGTSAGADSSAVADVGGGASSGGDDSAGASSGGASSGGTSSGGADAGPVGCSPACEIWQKCDAGLCVNKECAKDEECNAAGGPPAGVKPHYCYKGKCALFQCGKDEDCKDGKLCNDKTFLCYEKKTGCAIDSDCIDSNICTSDTCDTKTGKCQHKKLANCCNADLDCDDGSKCTTDTCNKQTSSCENKAKDKCCVEDANCADSSACTVDTCDKATGQCKFSKKAGCCEGDGACDDGVAATLDKCEGGKCVHGLAGMPTSCKAAADCKATKCASATCVGGKCSYAAAKGASGCCTSDAQCSLDKKCNENKCLGLICQAVPATKSGPWAWYRFDSSSLSGWKATNENKIAGWGHYTGTKVAGAGSLRYGVPGKKSWSAGVPNKGQVTSPEIAMPAGAKLDFFVHFDGEPGAGVHLFGLKVVEGSKETDVWSKNADLKGNTGGAWKPFAVDLGKWAGKKVKLRWWFDVTVKFPKEEGHGLAIDEMLLSGGCP